MAFINALRNLVEYSPEVVRAYRQADSPAVANYPGQVLSLFDPFRKQTTNVGKFAGRYGDANYKSDATFGTYSGLINNTGTTRTRLEADNRGGFKEIIEPTGTIARADNHEDLISQTQVYTGRKPYTAQLPNSGFSIMFPGTKATAMFNDAVAQVAETEAPNPWFFSKDRDRGFAFVPAGTVDLEQVRPTWRYTDDDNRAALMQLAQEIANDETIPLDLRQKLVNFGDDGAVKGIIRSDVEGGLSIDPDYMVDALRNIQGSNKDYGISNDDYWAVRKNAELLSGLKKATQEEFARAKGGKVAIGRNLPVGQDGIIRNTVWDDTNKRYVESEPITFYQTVTGKDGSPTNKAVPLAISMPNIQPDGQQYGQYQLRLGAPDPNEGRKVFIDSQIIELQEPNTSMVKKRFGETMDGEPIRGFVPEKEITGYDEDGWPIYGLPSPLNSVRINEYSKGKNIGYRADVEAARNRERNSTRYGVGVDMEGRFPNLEAYPKRVDQATQRDLSKANVELREEYVSPQEAQLYQDHIRKAIKGRVRYGVPMVDEETFNAAAINKLTNQEISGQPLPQTLYNKRQAITVPYNDRVIELKARRDVDKEGNEFNTLVGVDPDGNQADLFVDVKDGQLGIGVIGDKDSFQALPDYAIGMLDDSLGANGQLRTLLDQTKPIDMNQASVKVMAPYAYKAEVTDNFMTAKGRQATPLAVAMNYGELARPNYEIEGGLLNYLEDRLPTNQLTQAYGLRQIEGVDNGAVVIPRLSYAEKNALYGPDVSWDDAYFDLMTDIDGNLLSNNMVFAAPNDVRSSNAKFYNTVSRIYKDRTGKDLVLNPLVEGDVEIAYTGGQPGRLRVPVSNETWQNRTRTNLLTSDDPGLRYRLQAMMGAQNGLGLTDEFSAADTQTVGEVVSDVTYNNPQDSGYVRNDQVVDVTRDIDEFSNPNSKWSIGRDDNMGMYNVGLPKNQQSWVYSNALDYAYNSPNTNIELFDGIQINRPEYVMALDPSVLTRTTADIDYVSLMDRFDAATQSPEFQSAYSNLAPEQRASFLEGVFDAIADKSLGNDALDSLYQWRTTFNELQNGATGEVQLSPLQVGQLQKFVDLNVRDYNNWSPATAGSVYDTGAVYSWDYPEYQAIRKQMGGTDAGVVSVKEVMPSETQAVIPVMPHTKEGVLTDLENRFDTFEDGGVIYDDKTGQPMVYGIDADGNVTGLVSANRSPEEELAIQAAYQDYADRVSYRPQNQFESKSGATYIGDSNAQGPAVMVKPITNDAGEVVGFRPQRAEDSTVFAERVGVTPINPSNSVKPIPQQAVAAPAGTTITPQYITDPDYKALKDAIEVQRMEDIKTGDPNNPMQQVRGDYELNVSLNDPRIPRKQVAPAMTLQEALNKELELEAAQEAMGNADPGAQLVRATDYEGQRLMQQIVREYPVEPARDWQFYDKFKRLDNEANLLRQRNRPGIAGVVDRKRIKELEQRKAGMMRHFYQDELMRHEYKMNNALPVNRVIDNTQAEAMAQLDSMAQAANDGGYDVAAMRPTVDKRVTQQGRKNERDLVVQNDAMGIMPATSGGALTPEEQMVVDKLAQAGLGVGKPLNYVTVQKPNASADYQTYKSGALVAQPGTHDKPYQNVFTQTDQKINELANLYTNFRENSTVVPVDAYGQPTPEWQQLDQLIKAQPIDPDVKSYILEALQTGTPIYGEEKRVVLNAINQLATDLEMSIAYPERQAGTSLAQIAAPNEISADQQGYTTQYVEQPQPDPTFIQPATVPDPWDVPVVAVQPNTVATTVDPTTPAGLTPDPWGEPPAPEPPAPVEYIPPIMAQDLVLTGVQQPIAVRPGVSYGGEVQPPIMTDRESTAFVAPEPSPQATTVPNNTPTPDTPLPPETVVEQARYFGMTPQQLMMATGGTLGGLMFLRQQAQQQYEQQLLQQYYMQQAMGNPQPVMAMR